jgi:mRNA interferase MazF
MTRRMRMLRFVPRSSRRKTTRLAGTPRVGKSSVQRGEIRWYTFASPDKKRPVMLLTRNHVINSLNEIIVVPVTRTIRGLDTEVVLTTDDGMPVACALNFDHIALAQRSKIGALVTTLPAKLWPDAERALLVACGFPAR